MTHTINPPPEVPLTFESRSAAVDLGEDNFRLTIEPENKLVGKYRCSGLLKALTVPGLFSV